MKNILISVVGPTAIGKTKVAIALAKHFKTEIISADSRQFYKEMEIGTAVPSKEELESAKHHFIQHKSIFENYSVGDFERDALELLTILFKKKRIVIMVGGSGLYMDAVVKGLDSFPKVESKIREKLNKTLEDEGITVLQEKLKELDKEHYDKVDVNNPHRLIRALEICLGTGKPYSSFLKKKKPKRNFHTITIGLTADKEIVYHRINQRVDKMMGQGLLEEVASLKQHSKLNALQTVGYKELFGYLENQWDLDFAVSEIKKNTRRFAKRQFTWFRKNSDTVWIAYDTSEDEIIQRVENKISLIQLHED